MRRKTTNKKVLQAISIGLSAMIAVTSTPVSAIAAETEPTEPNPMPAEDPTQTLHDSQQQEAVEDAQSAVSDAVAPIDNAIEATIDAAAAVDNAKLDAADPNNKELIEAAEAITGGDGKGGDNDLASPSGEITKESNGTSDPVDGINEDLKELEQFGGMADDTVEAIGNTVNNLTAGAAKITQVTETAADQINDKITDINNATTEAGARTAYDELQQIASDTEDAFDDARSDYETKLAAYNTQLGNLETLEAAYNAELEAAGDGAAKVKKDLDVAKELADKLKKEAEDACNALSYNAQDMIRIAELIEKNQNDDGNNFRGTDGLRDLFKTVMAYYYLPTVGIPGVDADKLANITPDQIITVNYDDKSGATTYHYVEIDGVRYNFNYKLVKGTGTDVVIYKQRDVEVKERNGETIPISEFDIYTGAEDDKNYTKEAKEAIGTDEKIDENDKNITTIDKDGNIINPDGAFILIDNKLYKKGDADEQSLKTVGDQINIVKDENGNTIGYDVINSITSKTVSYSTKGNNIVRTETQNGTKTSYMNRTVTVESAASTSECETGDDAREAALNTAKADILTKDTATELENSKLITLGSGETVVNGSIEAIADTDINVVVDEKTTYTTTGTYLPMFKETIQFDEWVDDVGITSDTKTKNKGVQQTYDRLVQALQDDGYTLLTLQIGSAKHKEKLFDDNYYGKATITYVKSSALEGVSYTNISGVSDKFSSGSTYNVVQKRNEYATKDQILVKSGNQYKVYNIADLKGETLTAKTAVEDSVEANSDKAWNDLVNAQKLIDQNKANEDAKADKIFPRKTSNTDRYRGTVEVVDLFNYTNSKNLNKTAKGDAIVTRTYTATYSYDINYQVSKEGTYSEIVETEYKDSQELIGSVIQNKIYEDYTKGKKYDDSLMSIDNRTMKVDGKTVDLNRGLSSELAKAKKYTDLKDKADKATQEYGKAYKAVNAMIDAIEKIDTKDTRSELFSLNLEGFDIKDLESMDIQDMIDKLTGVLDEYGYTIVEGKLQIVVNSETGESKPLTDGLEKEFKLKENERALMESIANLINAANNMLGIQGQLLEAEDVLRDTIRRLTPPSTPAGEPDPGTPTTPGGTTPTVATLTAPAVPLATIPSLTAGAAGVVAGAGVGAAGAVVDAAAGAIADAGVAIPDAEVPLAAPTADLGNTKTGSEKLTDIDDTEVPLADDFDQSKANWLWLLIVALLGATGAEAYRRHQNKKKAMVAETTESKEEK